MKRFLFLQENYPLRVSYIFKRKMISSITKTFQLPGAISNHKPEKGNKKITLKKSPVPFQNIS